VQILHAVDRDKKVIVKVIEVKRVQIANVEDDHVQPLAVMGLRNTKFGVREKSPYIHL
jgi:hypothetical protein